MDTSSNAQQPAVASLDAVFEAIEGAGLSAAQLLLLVKGQPQLVVLMHDLINDLCVARLGTQLLQQQVDTARRIEAAKQAEVY